MPSQNRLDKGAKRSNSETARYVLQAHKAGLESRMESDLLREKLLLHIDGTDDFQWADIIQGRRVEIPRIVSEFRKTENLLRPVVDNAVAHHTTMPLRYFAQSLPDRRARERAMIDSLWMNHVANDRDLNGLFAEALYMAMATGFCPVHRYWREDQNDAHEPIAHGAGTPEIGLMGEVRPGMLDCWVGNPFDTVFDRGAKRHSIYWCSYGRVLPLNMVKATWQDVKEAKDLKGTNKIPDASIFQRIAKTWKAQSLGVHGTGVISYRRTEEESDEELILILCRETLPGVEADWPDGVLRIVAVPGAADLRRGEGQSSEAILLTEQPLPAKDFSFTNFYSSHRSEDVHGRPWVGDIDNLQVDLNFAISKHWEFVNKIIEAPIVVPGGAISDDMADLGGYNLLEMDPSAGGARPRVMEWPAYIASMLERSADDKRRAIYTLGGFQAASRGEAPGSRIAYKALVALQQADNTVHGPVNGWFRRSACEFAVGCWKQFKAYGTIPWLLNVTGDEYAHLAEPYVDNTKISNYPPSYKLVNAFGPSPELRAQEVMELMGTRGADGEPFITTEEARQLYPNQEIFSERSDPKAVQRRRARTIATMIHDGADKLRQEFRFDDRNLASQGVQQLALRLFMMAETQFPRLRDDDLQAHLSALSEITQDETADPIARLAAQRRQDLYFQWQASMAGTPGMPAPGGVAPGGAPQIGTGRQTPGQDQRQIAAQRMSGGKRLPITATARG